MNGKIIHKNNTTRAYTTLKTKKENISHQKLISTSTPSIPYKPEEKKTIGKQEKRRRKKIQRNEEVERKKKHLDLP